MRSILIVRPGALGDAILTVPLLEALLAAGVTRVTLLGTPASWRFLAPGAPVEIRDIDGRDWLGLFGEDGILAPRARAVAGSVEAAIVLLRRRRHTVEAALRAAGVPCVVGADPAVAGEAAAFVSDAPNPARPSWPPAPDHAAARLLGPLATLGLAASDALWNRAPRPFEDRALLRLTSEEIAGAHRTLGLEAVPRQGILALHPGSGGAAKCWPADRFAALAVMARERWGLRPVFLIGPADRTRWQALRAILPGPLASSALVNRPLREVLTLLSLARAHVGNDSGISHLAACAGPTLALFGPSDPRIWHPLGPRVATLRAPGGDLDALSVEAVGDALAELLCGGAY
jgi:heptosyltransferase-3